MATEATRDARPSLPALLALLLALIAGLSAPPLPAEHSGIAATVTAGASQHCDTTVEVAAAATTVLPPVPVAVEHCDLPAAGRERVLRTQLVVAARAARAPPAASV
ncbi:hypothetical protein ACWEOZ_43960 [Actinoplanes sp. NPDC004185]